MKATLDVIFIGIAAIIVIAGVTIAIYRHVHKLRADGTPKKY